VRMKAHFERTVAHFGRLGSKAPEAIVLGGGYGRGEGGIASSADGSPCLFNDLDYFIFTDSPADAEILGALHEWERKESVLMGIDVEGKCLPLSDLKQTPVSMMFYDLVTAHTIVSGPDDFFKAYQAMANPQTIVPIEATRLLWNRGSGLLFASADLEAGGGSQCSASQSGEGQVGTRRCAADDTREIPCVCQGAAGLTPGAV